MIVSFMNSKGLLILCTGDIVDGPGDPNKCIERLKADRIPTVLGNHDRWILNNDMRSLPGATPLSELTPTSLEFLDSLPRTLEFSTPDGAALLCHGLGQNDMTKLTPDDYGYALECNDEFQRLQGERHLRFVLHGHTHRRMVKRHRHQYFLNPGALLPDDTPGFQIIDFITREVVEYTCERHEIKKISSVRMQ